VLVLDVRGITPEEPVKREKLGMIYWRKIWSLQTQSLAINECPSVIYSSEIIYKSVKVMYSVNKQKHFLLLLVICNELNIRILSGSFECPSKVFSVIICK